nr:winged helix-turn-helix domain-containing protein [Streptomyces sp. TLI_235]
MTGPGWQPTLRYPPRGVATLWERREREPSRALAAVLGRTRALLLAELDEPASTGELARRTGVTPGGVSQHLGALREAGLLDAHRVGRQVLYARTEAAEVLLGAACS